MEQKAWIFQIKAVVTEDGIEGDGQRNRALHGGTGPALCPFSLDRLLVFQQEGTPIFPGAMGENLTLAGLYLPLLCRPVRTGFFTRTSQKKYPGWSRVYARVLQPGLIQVGDRVRLALPAD